MPVRKKVILNPFNNVLQGTRPIRAFLGHVGGCADDPNDFPALPQHVHIHQAAGAGGRHRHKSRDLV